MKDLSFSQQINRAIDDSMASDQNVLCFGLGVTDPKAVFGTTYGLEQKYGPVRVFDMPTSENAMTGVAIGMSLAGYKPVMTHQRLDFFLLAMDQLVNSAAKYHYMFGGQVSVPITIRLILGRGWGQGPTHSQNLQSWFAHIPGLKVVAPTTPLDAYYLLKESIQDPNPVVFLEHRWLHNNTDELVLNKAPLSIGNSTYISSGSTVTVVSSSYLTIQAYKACKYLENFSIFSDHIDLLTIKPLDIESIFQSVHKTGRLLVLDPGFETCSVGSDIIAKVTSKCWSSLKAPPQLLAMPDVPEPTSYFLTRGFYHSSAEIAKAIANLCSHSDPNITQSIDLEESLKEPVPHDIPGSWFSGPF
ncbi:alpha-ketoacid dehydrogenase subunit beta [Synechococcus sp. MIT S9451]|uniref:alpha-ketoacid dehydrogenase subunit beta n=1 Tax=Synechococcus sp. MIT S9451 TaxID=3082543 RepID=UPI0039B61566